MVALHLLLALLWAMANGAITPSSLIVGFIFGWLVLVFAGPALGHPRYGRRLRLAIGLLSFFLWELVVSSFRVAVDVLRPRLTMSPAIIAVPISLRAEGQIALLANLITLTPGTLSVDVSPDRTTLYVHAMYGDDPDAVRRTIRDTFERKIAEVFE